MEEDRNHDSTPPRHGCAARRLGSFTNMVNGFMASNSKVSVDVNPDMNF